MSYKIKTYKFKVTDKELDQVTKYHFTSEILKDLGIGKGSVYTLINKTHDNNRKKYSKYIIEKIREPYFITN